MIIQVVVPLSAEAFHLLWAQDVGTWLTVESHTRVMKYQCLETKPLLNETQESTIFFQNRLFAVSGWQILQNMP